MRFAIMLAAAAALWVQPAQAVTFWSFNVQAFTTGVTQFQGPDGVPVTTPVEMPLNFGIRVQAFTDTGNLSTYTATPPPYYDPTPLGGRYPLISGSLTLINGSITGTNFSYQGGPAQFGPCFSCDFFTLTAPRFAASFVGSSDGTAPVPEPATWAMMLFGFGAIGWAMRYRAHPALLNGCLAAHASA